MGGTKSRPGAGQTRCVVYTDRHFPSNFCFFVLFFPFWPSQPLFLYFLLTSLYFISFWFHLYLLHLFIFCLFVSSQLKADFLPCWQRIDFEGGIRMAEGEEKDSSWWSISCYRQLITMRGTFFKEYVKSLGRVRWWTWFCECQCIMCVPYRMSSKGGYKLVRGRKRLPLAAQLMRRSGARRETSFENWSSGSVQSSSSRHGMTH